MNSGLKISNRDRIFMMFAPMAFLAVGYWFFIARPMSSEIALLKHRDASLGTAEEIAAVRPGLEKKLQEISQSFSAAKAMQDEIIASSQPASGGEPAEMMRMLRELFHRHGGNVATSSLRDDELQFGQTAPVCVDLLKSFSSAAPHHWIFEVESDYAGMAAALDELANSHQCVIDSLSMRPDDTGASSCVWRLSLWM